ncbi:MAG: hypothetical protein CUN54_10085, partial [Phototrophicales bacterium]
LQQASADAGITDIYDDEIAKASDRRTMLSSRIRALQSEVARHDDAAQRELAFHEIVEISIERFWDQEDRIINQLLFRLMGNRRFIVEDGQIIGIADAPNRNRRS